MASFESRIRELLDNIEDKHNPTAEERREAMLIMAEIMQKKNLRLYGTEEDVKNAADKLVNLRHKLNAIHTRMDILTATGQISTSIH